MALHVRRVVPLLFFTCLLVATAGCKVEFNKIDGPPPIRGDASFGDVKLATEINDTSKEPITEVSTFASDSSAMHAAIKVKNVRAGAEFRFQWSKGGEQILMIVMSLPIDMRDNWVSGSLFPTDGLPVGEDWQADVLYNGDVISSTTFSVEPSGSAATGDPV